MPAKFAIVDLFAGPGGLAEGFSSIRDKDGSRPFQIMLSVEKEDSAFETLRFRSFFRQFNGSAPIEYYRFLNGDTSEPDWESLFPIEWKHACLETAKLELGSPMAAEKIDARLEEITKSYGGDVILIGGPPCQAYSLVGRARNKGTEGYEASKDHRHFLYKEYIRILQTLKPAAFVMENVKGLLSSSVDGERVFDQVLDDLSKVGDGLYSLIPLAPRSGQSLFGQIVRPPALDFVVRAEDHGIPQSRHRVFIVGIRADVAAGLDGGQIGAALLSQSEVPITVQDLLKGMPKLRSGLSNGNDSEQTWQSAASQMDAEQFRVLSIEDFNTKGLTGSVVDVDGGNFDRFWRAVGESAKKGKAGGRWGLGKLVYSSASALKLFYGLTITAEDPQPALLGQIVLQNHRIGNAFHPAHGFYFDGRSTPLDLQQPVRNADEIADIRALGFLSRTSQTGLSLIIPYLLEGIDETSIISGVISNYYFPILAGKLIVEVGSVVINKTTFLSIAAQYKPVHPIPFDFVKDISDTLDTLPSITALAPIGKAELNAGFFPPGEITQMKEHFASGDLVRVRVPVVVKPKDGPDETSFIDLYLKSLPEDEKPYCLIARNAITLPGERRYFGGGAAYAALVANDEEVSSFLGDAENPAHTAWNTKAKKLSSRWRSPTETLTSIRHSLRHFYAMIAEQAESEDSEALIDFFSILELNQTKKGRKPKKPKPVIDITSREKAISIRPRKGGFDLVAGPAAAKWTYPRSIRVRVAYDMIGANPFKRHSPYDFDLSKNEIDIEATDATYETLKPNILKVIAESQDFRLEFTGFDERRDIVVDARA